MSSSIVIALRVRRREVLEKLKAIQERDGCSVLCLKQTALLREAVTLQHRLKRIGGES